MPVVRKIVKKGREADLREPDKFQMFSVMLLEYVDKHRRKVMLVGSLMIVAILAVAGFFLMKSYNERQAGRLYAEALFSYNGNETNVNGYEKTLDLYKNVKQEYPGTKSAAYALFHMANIYYKLGMIDKATEAYEEYITKSDKHDFLYPLALSGLGYCYERLTEYEKAIDVFEKASALLEQGGYLEKYCMRDIARLYEKTGKKEKAREIYTKIVEGVDDPFVKKIVQRKIAMLEYK